MIDFAAVKTGQYIGSVVAVLNFCGVIGPL